jgi:hypothetical protein
MNSDRRRHLEDSLNWKRMDLENVKKALARNRDTVEEGKLNVQAQQLLDEIEYLESQLEKTVLCFPAVSNFDLHSIIGECLDEAIHREKLVGFSMGYSDSHFLENFSERLEMEWGRATTKVVYAPVLNPLINEADWTSKEISRLRKLLQISNIVYLVRICVSNPTSDLAKKFWSRIQKEFQGSHNYFLMTIMVCDQDCLLPSENIIKLILPPFKPSDFYRWFSEITKEEKWHKAKTQWSNEMMTICLANDSDDLDFFLIYSNLKSTLNQLRQEPSPEEFLEFVDLLFPKDIAND